jgi:prepilin-type N-terminal cleavage/methylation domain-containing protein
MKQSGDIQSSSTGFTLIELLVGIAVMGMIMVAFYQLADQIALAYRATAEKQGILPQARAALERMVMFVQESDEITKPDTADPGEMLTVSERLSDQYNNASHAYTAAGDGILDADNDGDGLINHPLLNPQDPPDYITYSLDKTDPANWRLVEQMPNYGTAQTGDFLAARPLCERVQAFSCRRLSAGLVEISLTLQQGNAAVTLRTAAKARWVE